MLSNSLTQKNSDSQSRPISKGKSHINPVKGSGIAKRAAELESRQGSQIKKRSSSFKSAQQAVTAKSMRSRLTLSALFLLILSLGFNAFFMWTSIEKLYVESLISKFSLIGQELQKNTEEFIDDENTPGKSELIIFLLEKAKQRITEKISGQGIMSGTVRKFFVNTDVSVSITLPDGSILYSVDEKMANTKLPEVVWTAFKNSDEENHITSVPSFVKYNSSYFIALPLHNLKRDWLGSIVIKLGEKRIQDKLSSAYKESFKVVIGILICAMSLLIILLNFAIKTPRDTQNIQKKKISVFICVVIGLAQVMLVLLNINQFKIHHLQINQEKAEIATSLLKEDIEYLLASDITIKESQKLETIMQRRVAADFGFNEIILYNKDYHPLYIVNKNGIHVGQKAINNCMNESNKFRSENFKLRTNILRNGNNEGFIITRVSNKILWDEIKDIVLDSVTVIIISLLFFVEVLILLFRVIDKRIAGFDKPKNVNFGVIRPASFLFLFGIDIAVSFLPLHMEKLYEPIFGLSKDMIMGLPITTEFAFVGFALLISGAWIDRRGWHQPFFCGLILAGLGVLYSWLAPNAIHFIVSRAVVGLGYGLTLMACQGFIIAYSDSSNKTQAFAQFIAGMYAGSICGGATGAMLAERIGYNAVFLLGSFILFSVIAYGLIFMRNAIKKPEKRISEKNLMPVKSGQFGNFFSNRIVLSLILLSSLPAAIATVGFFNYFSPIYLNRIGASQATIGRVLMIYGISLIYIGPMISRYVDKSQNKKIYIFTGCVLGSLTFLVFHVLDGIIAATVAVFLLGLSSSFIIASQAAYLLKLKVSHDLGTGKALGIFRSSSRIGQAIGPIIFSGLIVNSDINASITQFGLVYLISALLFFILTQRENKIEVLEHY